MSISGSRPYALALFGSKRAVKPLSGLLYSSYSASPSASPRRDRLWVKKHLEPEEEKLRVSK